MENLQLTTVTTARLAYYKALAKRCTRQIGYLPYAAIEARAETGNVWYASINADPIGFYVIDQLRTDPRVAAIQQIAVQEDARRQAYATSAVRRIEETMRGRGVEVVRLWCAEDIEAPEFWKMAGYLPGPLRNAANARRRQVRLWSRRLQDTAADPATTSAGSFARIDAPPRPSQLQLFATRQGRPPYTDGR